MFPQHIVMKKNPYYILHICRVSHQCVFSCSEVGTHFRGNFAAHITGKWLLSCVDTMVNI
jgi:hypothetical protein